MTKQEPKVTGYYWILFKPEKNNVGSSQTVALSNTESENTRTFWDPREKLVQSCHHNIRDLRPREKAAW